jgi:hypothetical protein
MVFPKHVTKDIVQVLQGIILFVAAEAFFRGPFNKYGLLKRSKVSVDDERYFYLGVGHYRRSAPPRPWCWLPWRECFPNGRA